VSTSQASEAKKGLIVMLYLLLALTLAQTDVTIRTLDGQTASGQLVRVSDREVVISAAGQEQSFAPGKLEAISVSEQATPAKGKVQVGLVDGSLLHGASYSVAGGKVKVALLDGTVQELPLKSVQSVKLREQTGELAAQWDDYASREATGDRLVVRRKAAGGADSLDILDGVIKDISDTAIVFNDGSGDLKVKRERVDGLLYFRGVETKTATPACIVVDIDNSRWSAKSLVVAGKSLQLTTLSGAKVELPLARVRRLDYAAGNRQLLAELPRESLSQETWFTVAGKEPARSFAPQVGRTPEGPITIGGELCPTGLWLPAKTALIVRVPAGFTRLTARVGIEDRVASSDGARLKIEADGKTLYDELVRRGAQPAALDVDLQSARRLRITVDYGGESFLGDQLVLCDAMFTK
jgi:hypothetical protein